MIVLNDVVKEYKMGDEIIHALNHVSLNVAEGEYVAISGPSGSGKSTLMNIIGCLDVPDSGSYILDGQDISRLNDRQLSKMRSLKIGFVFQSFNLLPRLSALENVEMPLVYQGIQIIKRRQQAKEMLKHMGLIDRIHHQPNQLSGGQQQRVAIARALVSKPHLILADEPTGNLDRKTGDEIMALFDELHSEGNTIVLITHDNKVANRAQRVIYMVDGKTSDTPLSEEVNEEVGTCNP